MSPAEASESYVCLFGNARLSKRVLGFWVFGFFGVLGFWVFWGLGVLGFLGSWGFGFFGVLRFWGLGVLGLVQWVLVQAMSDLPREFHASSTRPWMGPSSRRDWESPSRTPAPWPNGDGAEGRGTGTGFLRFCPELVLQVGLLPPRKVVFRLVFGGGKKVKRVAAPKRHAFPSLLPEGCGLASWL